MATQLRDYTTSELGWSRQDSADADTINPPCHESRRRGTLLPHEHIQSALGAFHYHGLERHSIAAAAGALDLHAVLCVSKQHAPAQQLLTVTAPLCAEIRLLCGKASSTTLHNRQAPRPQKMGVAQDDPVYKRRGRTLKP